MKVSHLRCFVLLFFFFSQHSITFLRVSDAGHDRKSWQPQWILSSAPLISRLKPPLSSLRLVAEGGAQIPLKEEVWLPVIRPRKLLFLLSMLILLRSPSPPWSERRYCPLEDVIRIIVSEKYGEKEGGRKGSTPLFPLLLPVVIPHPFFSSQWFCAVGSAAAGLIIASLRFCRCIAELPPSTPLTTHSITPPHSHDLIRVAIQPIASLAAATKMTLMRVQIPKRREKNTLFFFFLLKL